VLSFREFLEESFNSSIDIFKEYSNDDFEYFELKIRQYHYRIVLETNDDNDIGLHFEIFHDSRWFTKGMVDDLSTKEVMALFGTLFKVIKDRKFNSLWLCSSEGNKLRLYKKLANKLQKYFKVDKVSEESLNSVKCFVLSSNSTILDNIKFKFKDKK
jgi:hypothetical protein